LPRAKASWRQSQARGRCDSPDGSILFPQIVGPTATHANSVRLHQRAVPCHRRLRITTLNDEGVAHASGRPCLPARTAASTQSTRFANVHFADSRQAGVGPTVERPTEMTAAVRCTAALQAGWRPRAF